MVYGEGSHGVRRIPGFSFVRRIGCARHIRRWPAPGRLPVLPAPHPSFQQQPGIYDYGATRYGRSDRPPALQGRPSHQRPSLAGSPARSDCILRWHRTISRALAICRDPLFTFLQALGVYLAIRALYDPRVRWPLLCGIAIGLSFWVETVAISSAILIPIVLLCAARGGSPSQATQCCHRLYHADSDYLYLRGGPVLFHWLSRIRAPVRLESIRSSGDIRGLLKVHAATRYPLPLPFGTTRAPHGATRLSVHSRLAGVQAF